MASIMVLEGAEKGKTGWARSPSHRLKKLSNGSMIDWFMKGSFLMNGVCERAPHNIPG